MINDASLIPNFYKVNLKYRFIGVNITNLQQLVSVFELYRKLLGDNAPVRDRHCPFSFLSVIRLYQLLPYFSFRSLYSHPYIASANAPVRLHRRCLSTSGHRAALCIADVKSQAVSKQYQALIRYVNNPSVGFESFHYQPD